MKKVNLSLFAILWRNQNISKNWKIVISNQSPGNLLTYHSAKSIFLNKMKTLQCHYLYLFILSFNRYFWYVSDIFRIFFYDNRTKNRNCEISSFQNDTEIVDHSMSHSFKVFLMIIVIRITSIKEWILWFLGVLSSLLTCELRKSFVTFLILLV